MEQTVYIDLYFIINFAMDFLCFFLTSRLLSIRENHLRILAASAFGGAYACLALFLPLGSLWGLALDIVACVIMSAIAYLRASELGRLPSYALVYTAVSIVLGGAMTALFSIFNRIGLDKMLGSAEDTDGISVWIFALLALISGLFSVLGARFFKKKTSLTFCKIRIYDRGRMTELLGLCDSGNLLCDPISARYCIIMELSAAKGVLCDRTYRAIERGRPERVDSSDISRIRVIPVNTVSGTDMMYAIRFEKTEIDFGGGYRNADVLVAFSMSKINAEGATALVPTSLDFDRIKN